MTVKGYTKKNILLPRKWKALSPKSLPNGHHCPQVGVDAPPAPKPTISGSSPKCEMPGQVATGCSMQQIQSLKGTR